MAQHNELGKRGEDLAEAYLIENGYRIIQRNGIYNRNEVDIIASNSEFIIFVEVKTRKKDSMVAPLDSITPEKKRRIITTALLYLQNHPSLLQPRFDVFSKVTEDKRVVFCEHLKGAFDADGY